MKNNRQKLVMKKVMGLLAFLILAQGVYSQSYVPSKADIDLFFKTKTLVVLEDNPMLQYNLIIRNVIKEQWTITDYEFITFKEFEEKREDPQYSFLLMTSVSFEKDKLNANYNFLQLLQGKKSFRVNQMPEICSVPLAYKGVYEDSYVYKLGTLVRFIQKHVMLLKEKPGIVSSNALEYYSKNTKSIKSKVLYLVEDELSKEINSAARIKKIYPFKFKIVTREEIEEAIDNKEENVVFLHKVGPEGTRINARCYKVIIGVTDADFYYFDFHMINDKKPDGLLESDLKKIAKKSMKE